MSCLTIRDLYEYLEKGMPAGQTRDVEDHLLTCPKCRRALEERRLIAAAASSLPPFEVPEDFPERVMARVFRSKARKPAWLIGLTAGISFLTLTSVALIVSGKSALEFFSSVSHSFWEYVKSAALLAAKLAALLSLAGRTLRSLLEAGTKSVSVLTSLVQPGVQVFILILALGIVISLLYGMRKKISIGD